MDSAASSCVIQALFLQGVISHIRMLNKSARLQRIVITQRVSISNIVHAPKLWHFVENINTNTS